MTDLEHHTTGRNRRTVIAVIILLLLIIMAYTLLDAHPVILAGIALFMLPALWDLYSNRASGLHLTDHMLSWFSGTSRGEIPLIEVKHVRFDTRLDLSVRVTIFPIEGRKFRLPQEATPPPDIFRTALEARNIRTERHHFTLLN